jgi:hypothetical protein
VIGGAWFVGWSVSPFAPAPQANATAIDDLASRMARIESGSGKSQPLSSAATTRFDALEASIASLRRDLAAAHGQSEKLAATVKDLQSAPQTASAAPDLSAITKRLDQIESSARTLAADTAKHDAPPADETALRRVIAATLLNVSAQHGEPYAEVLAASKALITDPETLKPMDAFASSGVPTANALCRELLAIVPKLAPAPAVSTTGTGIVDRLQEGAARLVRIERTDATEGNSANAVVARITAAALHNDVARARHELDELSPSDRAAAQPWIAKVDARDAALATSHQFAAGAMAAMTKPAK